MRRLLVAGCLILALASLASSQSENQPKPAEAPPPSTAPETPAETPKPDPVQSESDALAQCLRDWDAATHMTRQQWARTCRRVVANRARFTRDQTGK